MKLYANFNSFIIFYINLAKFMLTLKPYAFVIYNNTINKQWELV